MALRLVKIMRSAKGLPVSDLSTLGASYMTKLEADMGESLTWVLLHRSAENTVRTSENASKIDLTGLEGAETEEGYEFTLQPLIDVVAAFKSAGRVPFGIVCKRIVPCAVIFWKKYMKSLKPSTIKIWPIFAKSWATFYCKLYSMQD